MDQVFDLLRIEVVAVVRCKNLHRCFQISWIVFGVLDALVHTLAGVADLDKATLELE